VRFVLTLLNQIDGMMTMKIFLTGRSGSGKSTVLMKIIGRLEAKGLKIGGIITPEVRVKGRRVAFRVVDLSSCKEGVLASIDQTAGPKVGKYRVNVLDFERVALPALSFALKECDLTCVDELGKMEFLSNRFKQKVGELLRSERPLIAVVHCNYAKLYEKTWTLFQVTAENREEIVNTVVSKFMNDRP
jgi:nucleoside-triphosphatase